MFQLPMIDTFFRCSECDNVLPGSECANRVQDESARVCKKCWYEAMDRELADNWAFADFD